MEDRGREEDYNLPIIEPKTTDPSHAAKQNFEYFLILDFEATCDNKGWKNPEIIEFPTVLYNAKTFEIEDEFHHYIKPTLNPQLTPFCTELTGIQQDWVDKGLTLTQALEAYDKWLVSRGLISHDPNHPNPIILKPFAFVTCGNWDLFQMLPGQCKREKIERANYFRKWINIKEEFQAFYSMKNLLGMAGMLHVTKIPLTGKHHSGIDDCRNITKILKRMIFDGCTLKITGNMEKAVVPEETKPVDLTENTELVNKLTEISQKILNEDLEKEALSRFPNITQKEIQKIRGLTVKSILEKIKELCSEDFESLKPVDKKSLTSRVNDNVNKLVTL